jgi:26S proteasome regulatory subunit T1
MPDDPTLGEKEAPIRALDEEDIAFLKNYGLGPYAAPIKKAEQDVKDILKRVNDIAGIKESDTGLAPPSRWDLVSDKQMMQEEHPLQVARCTKIINPNTDEAKYVINVKQIAKFVVGLGDKVAPTDIEEGMRVGVDRTKYQIQIPLPPKIDPSVTMMTVEEKPDVTYSDIGGSKEQIEKMREVVELPMLHPEKFVQLGIDPPKGVLCYGPPGTGKTLLARAVANRTDACFIRVIGSELVQKYVGEGARMVRELFQMARSKKACIIFFDEVDAIGGARFDDGSGGCAGPLQGCCRALLACACWDVVAHWCAMLLVAAATCKQARPARSHACAVALKAAQHDLPRLPPAMAMPAHKHTQQPG